MEHTTPSHYHQRINRVIDYIVQHLDQPLQLDVLAKRAHFSAFHFHRIFHAAIGETLNQFVTRLRLEKALWLRVHKPRQSFTQIALACGFASSSDFSRRFKERYGVPPRAFDLESWRGQRREEIEAATFGTNPRPPLHLPTGANPDGFQVLVRALPPRCVAYWRVLHPYRPRAVWHATQRMLAWAREHKLADGQWLGYQWEDPEIVPIKDCRYDIGLVVPEVKPTGQIGRIEFPAMHVVEVEVRGTIDLEIRALDWLYREWLPHSGYVPAEQPGFEAWIGLPYQHGEAYFEIKVQVPVERG